MNMTRYSLLISLYLLLLLVKHSNKFLVVTRFTSATCRCAGTDKRSPPYFLSYSQGGSYKTTTCVYAPHGVYLHCIYSSSGSLIVDNDRGYYPESIGGCVQGSMCPAKDTHGTSLSDARLEDGGDVICMFGNGGTGCLYNDNEKLKDDKNNGACPSTVSGGSAATKPSDTCPAKDTRGTALSNTLPQNGGTLACAFGNGGCLYNSDGKLLEDQNGNACPSTTGSSAFNRRFASGLTKKYLDTRSLMQLIQSEHARSEDFSNKI